EADEEARAAVVLDAGVEERPAIEEVVRAPQRAEIEVDAGDPVPDSGWRPDRGEVRALGDSPPVVSSLHPDIRRGWRGLGLGREGQQQRHKDTKYLPRHTGGYQCKKQAV